MSEHTMIPKWEPKVWGWACHLQDGDLLLSMLKVNVGFRCSTHKHEHRWNQFHVVSGKLVVDLFRMVNGVPERVDWVLMFPGDSYTVTAGQYHCFRVIESGYVVETYGCDDGTVPDVNDIVRFDEGGPIT